MKTIIDSIEYNAPFCEVIPIVFEKPILEVSPGGGEGTGDDEI